MRLSEAIRLGSMSVKQHCGDYFDRDDDGQIVGACALGTALFAVGERADNDDWELGEGFTEAVYFDRFFDHQLSHAYPQECPAIAGCRYFHDREMDVYETIVHLNDDHLWSREAIATWVAAQEDAVTAAHAPASDPVETPVAARR